MLRRPRVLLVSSKKITSQKPSIRKMFSSRCTPDGLHDEYIQLFWRSHISFLRDSFAPEGCGSEPPKPSRRTGTADPAKWLKSQLAFKRLFQAFQVASENPSQTSSEFSAKARAQGTGIFNLSVQEIFATVFSFIFGLLRLLVLASQKQKRQAGLL